MSTVEANLKDGAGQALTSTQSGAQRGLDVNLVNSGVITPSSDFAILFNNWLATTQEKRIDLTTYNNDATNPAYYFAMAADGSLTSDAVWKVARVYLSDKESNGGVPTRIRFRSGVAYDSRASGWT